MDVNQAATERFKARMGTLLAESESRAVQAEVMRDYYAQEVDRLNVELAAAQEALAAHQQDAACDTEEEDTD